MIYLCPGSAMSQSFKRWPVKKFYDLSKLLKERNYEIAVILGREEIELASFFPDTEVFCDLNLIQLSSMISIDDLCVCNDSFLMHFFSAIKIPTLVIYGPTDHLRTLPPNADMIESKLRSKTRPCWGTNNYGKCNDGRCTCLDGLEVEDVMIAIESRN